MKHVYMLFIHPYTIMGVFTTGKKLADAAKNISPMQQQACMVHHVPIDQLAGHVGGHDHQGTWLNEFLATPAAQSDKEA